MKGVVGEYGMLVIVMIIASVMAVYSFGSQSGSVRDQVAFIQPKQTLTAGNNMNQLKYILEKANPELEIQTQKLTAGERYCWMQFVIKAVDADGQKLEVALMSVTGPDKTERNELETVVQKGTYTVTYRVADQDGLTTEKQVYFVAD